MSLVAKALSALARDCLLRLALSPVATLSFRPFALRLKMTKRDLKDTAHLKSKRQGFWL